MNWNLVPPLVKKVISTWDFILDIDKTRTYPHIYTFWGRKDGIEYKITFNGPPYDFLDPYLKNECYYIIFEIETFD